MKNLLLFCCIYVLSCLLSATCLAWNLRHENPRFSPAFSAAKPIIDHQTGERTRIHAQRRPINSNSSNCTADPSRRTAMRRALMLCVAAGCGGGTPTAASAVGGASRSRTMGYSVQKTEEEWKSLLTPRQYDILRNGGTERQYSSVLEGENRKGTFRCAGCGTALFASNMKFKSGTGWPSFASALDGVQVEKVNPIQMNLGGAELRCKTCGGHLGDVFNDGFIFVGTPAAETGKRFCIDGSALVFKPDDGGAEVIGDQVPSKVEYFYN